LRDRGSRTARGRRLAVELRRLREGTGLTGEEVAEHLGWSGSKVSRIELQRTGVKLDDLDRLLDLYQVPGPHREQLLALARESSQQKRLKVLTARFPANLAAYVELEAQARSVWNWEPQIVPGLLQTPDYARAVMRSWESMFALPPGDTERRVQARLTRQQVVTGDKPLELSVVMDESVLHRRLGDTSLMRQQLELLAQTSELPNVTLQVFPVGEEQPLAIGPFSYMRFAQLHEVPLHDIVSIEHLHGTFYLEDEDHTHMYRVAFEYLTAHSLEPAQSRELIFKTARETWS
jgi:transcriptional regulator with XRE-family HTH domain